MKDVHLDTIIDVLEQMEHRMLFAAKSVMTEARKLSGIQEELALEAADYLEISQWKAEQARNKAEEAREALAELASYRKSRAWTFNEDGDPVEVTDPEALESLLSDEGVDKRNIVDMTPLLPQGASESPIKLYSDIQAETTQEVTEE